MQIKRRAKSYLDVIKGIQNKAETSVEYYLNSRVNGCKYHKWNEKKETEIKNSSKTFWGKQYQQIRDDQQNMWPNFNV